ncbi:MAG TPA: hypothetical protein DEP05_07575 [Betaproteobacteria bacterium]|nr:hypothetical protein [Betaproteobacteria bacterium]
MNPPFADNLLYGYVRWRVARRGAPALLDIPAARASRRILLMLTTGLGDAVFSSVVFGNLRRAFPEADIRLFCRNGWKNLFAADPNLNGVIGYPGKYRRFFPTLKKLRAFGPELTLVLHGNDPDILPLAYLAGSRWIVRIPWRNTRYHFLLANRERPEDAATLPDWHYIDNRLRILDTIGVETVERAPRLSLPASAIESLRHKLEAPGQSYWVYHAFAADPYKSWPITKARQLLEQALSTWPNLAIVLSGGPKDREKLSTLIAGLPPERVANLAGVLRLEESAACLAAARFVVAPDTGVLHLAAALDVPTVALFAPTSADRVGPRSAHAHPTIIQQPRTCEPCLTKHCPHTPRHCMNQITVAEVRAAMTNIMRQTGPRT